MATTRKSQLKRVPAVVVNDAECEVTSVWRVSMNKFRCYNSRIIEFTNGLVRLKGESGTGKTTVIRALRWALYGVGKHAPINNEKAKTIVNIRCPFFEVERSVDPQMLRLSQLVDGKIVPLKATCPMNIGFGVLINDAAQSYINKILGPYSVWDGSISVPQDETHTLMTKVAIERRDFITSMVYKDEDPDIITEDIELSAKTAKNSSTSYDTALAAIPTTHKNEHICPNKPTGNVAELKEQIAALTKDRASSVSALRKAAEVSKKVVELELLQRQLDEMLDIPTTDSTSKSIDSLRVIQDNKKKYQRPIADKEYLESQLQGKSYPSTASLRKLVKQKADREKNVEIAEQLGITYNQESIEILIEKLMVEVNSLKSERDLITKYNSLVKKRDELLRAPPAPDASLLQNLKDELHEINNKLGGDCNLSCPECGVLLKMSKNQLVAGNTKAPDEKTASELKKKRDRLQQQITSYETAVRKSEISAQNLVATEIELSSIGDVSTQQDYDTLISDTISAINMCKSIVVIDEITADCGDETIRCAEMYEKLKKIVIPTDVVIRDVSDELNNLEIMLEKCKTRDVLVSKIASIGTVQVLDTSIIQAKIDECDAKISTIGAEIDKLNTELAEYATHSNCASRRDLVQKKIESDADLYVAREVMTISRNIQENMMVKVISNINNGISYLIPELFPEEPGFAMEVSTYRVTKTGKKVVQDITLNITNYGKELTEPSSGQRKRLAFILSLACARVFGAKILMCDENLGGISEDKREQCLQTMRILLPNIPIFIVSHDDPDGFFDHIIECSKSKW